MTKIVLDSNVTNMDTAAIPYNENFRKIEDALNDKVLYRKNVNNDPNEISNDIDFNGKRIYNLPPPQDGTEPLRKMDIGYALVASIIGGEGIDVDNTDPANPKVSAWVSNIVPGAGTSVSKGSGGVYSVSANLQGVDAGPGITMDNSNPGRPKVVANLRSLQAGAGVAIDNSNPASPVISSTGGDLQAGDGIAIDKSNPNKPVISADVADIRAGDGILVDTSTNKPLVSATLVDVVQGSGVTIDKTIPARPVISAKQVDIQAGDGITVNKTNPEEPVIAAKLQDVMPGAGVTIDKTNPAKPVISATAGPAPVGPHVRDENSWVKLSPGTNVSFDDTSSPGELIISAAQGGGGGGGGDLLAVNNLSELTNKATARTNLGLGSAAVANIGSGPNDIPKNSDISLDAEDVPLAPINTLTSDNVQDGMAEIQANVNNQVGFLNGVQYVQGQDIAALQNDAANYLQKADNLSDLANAGSARTNLGLGSAAVLSEGSSDSSLPTVATVKNIIGQEVVQATQAVAGKVRFATPQEVLDGVSTSTVVSPADLPEPGGSVPDATTTVKGKARIATNVEVTEGTLPDAIVSPSGLTWRMNNDNATTAARGRVQLATDAEASSAASTTKAITPSTMRYAIANSSALEATTSVRGTAFKATAAQIDSDTSTSRALFLDEFLNSDRWVRAGIQNSKRNKIRFNWNDSAMEMFVDDIYVGNVNTGGGGGGGGIATDNVLAINLYGNDANYPYMAVNVSPGYTGLVSSLPADQVGSVARLQSGNSSNCQALVNLSGQGIQGRTITWSASDARLKENIQPSETNALEKIDGLKFYSFKFKHDENSENECGFIAQQAEKIYPKMVMNNEDCPKEIDTFRALSLAMKAIQELSEKVKALEQALEDKE